MLSLTGRDEVKARVGRELRVSDWKLITQENLDGFAQAQVTGEQQFGRVDAESCRRTTA